MSRLAAVALVVLSGCLPAQPRLAVEAAPPFDVVGFFQGETAGLGVLHVRGRSPVVVEVESVGTVLDDGALELVQTVTRGGDTPYQRTWTFRALEDGRYTGDLTEATGPVEAVAMGNRLLIRYRTGRFTTVSQTLELQPGGRVALNLLSVRVLGIPIARLTEQIRVLEAGASRQTGPVLGAT